MRQETEVEGRNNLFNQNDFIMSHKHDEVLLCGNFQNLSSALQPSNESKT